MEGRNAEDRRGQFTSMTNKGILKFNKQCTEEEPFQTVKSSTGEKMMHAKTCGGPYCSMFFIDIAKCANNRKKTSMQGYLAWVVKRNVYILGSFQESDVGNMCQTDKTLQYIGRHIFDSILIK